MPKEKRERESSKRGLRRRIKRSDIGQGRQKEGVERNGTLKKEGEKRAQEVTREENKGDWRGEERARRRERESMRECQRERKKENKGEEKYVVRRKKEKGEYEECQLREERNKAKG